MITRQATGMAQRPLRRKLLTPVKLFTPGQRKAGDHYVHGGGGPENAGAVSTEQTGLPFRMAQPPQGGEADAAFQEYTGFAAPSVTPDMAGIPANNFRFLGENHGGRG